MPLANPSEPPVLFQPPRGVFSGAQLNIPLLAKPAASRWPGGGIHPARKTTGMALAAPRPQHVWGLFAEPGADPAWIYTQPRLAQP